MDKDCLFKITLEYMIMSMELEEIKKNKKNLDVVGYLGAKMFAYSNFVEKFEKLFDINYNETSDREEF